MRKILLFTFILFSCLNTIYSQVYQGKEAEKYISGSQIVRFSENNKNPTYIKLNPYDQPNFYEMNNWLSKTFNTGDYFGVNLLGKETDKIGYEHYRYQQTYKNIPIREAVFIIHVRKGKIESFNGNIFNNPNVTNSIVFSEEQAQNNAISSVNAEEYMWQNQGNELWIKNFTGKTDATYFPIPVKQIIYNSKDQSFRFAYKFDIYASKPLSRQDVYVDAESGKILKTLNTLHTGNANGTAVTKYSGTKPIITDSVAPAQFRLRETGRGNGIQTYNMLQQTNYSSAIDFTDDDNYWNNVNPQMDEAATDAHWGAEMTYDYYFNEHGRNGIDGNGFALFSYVHYDVSYSNAFWDGQRMTYGDGNNNPYSALDICGHEITHGLDSYTADLDYEGESGAMNEGFSDIFGTAIEFYAKPSQANWTCGENIGFVIRDLQNPNANQDPDTYKGDYWDLGQEVHQNSTVLSHWYYLTSQGGSGTNDIGNAYSVTGIGITKASDVAFRMLTVYLTSSSDYAEACFYAIVSATDLYGGCTPEVEAVTNAMYAVGLGASYVSAVTVDFTATNTQVCSSPNIVQFINQSTNATSYTWDFGDSTFSSFENPSHTYNSAGNFNVKLIGQSEDCGSDSIQKNSFISIAAINSNYAIMPKSGTGQTLTCCTGTLFDSGGENGNYSNLTNSKITIAPIGAVKVMLNFTSFDFESGFDHLFIYDGPTTAYPLIGKFDGTNLPNGGMIESSAGSITLRQITDGAVTASGFKLTWQCSLPSLPPQSNFYASETATCSGVVHFHDMTVNIPASWLWDFGDGNTSTLRDPVHVYLSNGVYNVKLNVTNAFGSDSTIKTSYIEVNNLPTLPTVTPGNACDSNSVTLSASGNGQLEWYDTLTDGELLYTGSTFITPVLYTTTTYYVEDKIISPSQYVGKSDNSGSGGNYNNSGNSHYEIFNCYSPATLVSVKVYANGTDNRTILLRDTNQTILQSLTANIPDGESRVTLNFPIPVQNNLQLVCIGYQNLYHNNNNSAIYPYTLPGLLSITESSASKPPYNINGNYYFFYDWEIKESECSSPRAPVVATITNCSGIKEINENSTLKIYPNPAHDILFVEFYSNTKEFYNITINDVIGKTIQNNIFIALKGFNKFKIECNTFEYGVYFINLKGNNQNIIQKIIIN